VPAVSEAGDRARAEDATLLSSEALKSRRSIQGFGPVVAAHFGGLRTTGLIEIARQRSEMIGFPQEVQVPSSQSLSGSLLP